MNPTTARVRMPLALTAVLLATVSVLAQQDQSAAPSTNGSAATAQSQPAAADQVLDQMLEQVRENPVVEPTHQPAPSASSSSQPLVVTDLRLLGVAPGAKATLLRPEGEFVVSRRGRLIAVPDSSMHVFSFDADSQFAEEPPMFLMPCQLTQDMEEMVQQQGQSPAFIVTGQVFVYRGANYLLPTMMKVSVDRGNLQP